MIKKIGKKANAALTRAKFGKAPQGSAPPSLDAISFTKLNGDPLDPAVYQGKVLLFVNVASRCGLTPQYETLVELHQRFKTQGFLIIGVPCNQFMGQEPGSAEEIQAFCSTTYGIDFPLLEKQDVNGSERSPLYQFLIESEAGGGEDISWNFEKFLVDHTGQVRHRFAPRTEPDDPTLVEALEALLSQIP